MATLEEIQAEIRRQTLALNGGKEFAPLPQLTFNGLPVVHRKEDIKGHCYLFLGIKDGKTYFREYSTNPAARSPSLWT